jgi:nicotinamidase-related amidase
MQGLDLARTSLLLLDFQNYGLHPDGYWAKQGEPGWPSGAYPAVENAARALAAARSVGLLVVHVGAAWRPGSPEMNMHIPVFARGPDRSVQGTWGAEFYEPVAPMEDEIVLCKRSVSAFIGTELDRLFRVRDVNTLVFTGVATNFAVEGSAREAVDRGYRAIVLEDCCASHPPDMHDFSIRRILPVLCEVATADEFISQLQR